MAAVAAVIPRNLHWGSMKKAYKLILALLLVVVIVLCFLVVPYGDDYYYGTAFQRGYLQHKLLEYTEMNGRVLVHLWDELTLLFDVWLYRLLAPAMLLACAFLACRRGNRYWQAAMTLALFCTLNVQLLREAFLWITGFFNYVYPVLMCLIVTKLQEKRLATEKTPWYYYAIAFVAGATTEQGGLMALLLLILPTVYDKVQGKVAAIEKPVFYLPIATTLGWFSVMLAPGVFNRMEHMGEFGLGERLWNNFGLRAQEIMGADGFWFLPAILLLLIGITAIGDKKVANWLRLMPLASLFMTAVGLGLPGNLFGKPLSVYACILAIVLILVWAVSVATVRHYKWACIFAVVGLASQGIMLPIAGSSFRTTFGAAIFLIFACVQLAAVVVRYYKPKYLRVGFLTAAALAGLFMVAPTIGGYWSNKAIHDANIASCKQGAKTGSEIVINTEADVQYGFTLHYTYSYYVPYFRQYYHIPPEAKLYYENKDYLPLYLGQEKQTHYVYTQDGKQYLPLRPLAEAMGGYVTWEDDYTTLIFNNEPHIMDNKTNLYDGKHDFSDQILYLSSIYVEADALCRGLGLDLEIRRDRAVLTVQ